MTLEDKNLLLKDLCARLPYGVKCWASYNKFPTTLVDVNVDAHADDDFFIVTVKLEKTGLNSPSLIEDIKPYLRPMSSMTEEEKDELYTAMDWYGNIDEFGNVYTKGQEKVYRETFYEYTDWLNSHHFDYRGLIEKGLALEAPDNMYKTE